ncbi:MAG: DUF2721 domain-containing protein [Cyanobacteria bacterium K_DeepCast_35m_m2_023]|nr:DUF2721 domain-containing protein [Cyanobacteria bacterium K_DeepCast_35m_m2_023]
MGAVSADIAKVSQTLQVSAAPVFMLAAITSLLLVLSNRLHYIGERLKLMEQELALLLEQNSDAFQEQSQHNLVIDKFCSVRKLLHKRITLTRNAMAFAALSGLLISLDVGVLFYGALSGSHVSFFVAATFMAAMVCFQVSLLYFLRELLGRHCIAELGPLLKYNELYLERISFLAWPAWYRSVWLGQCCGSDPSLSPRNCRFSAPCHRMGFCRLSDNQRSWPLNIC